MRTERKGETEKKRERGRELKILSSLNSFVIWSTLITLLNPHSFLHPLMLRDFLFRASSFFKHISKGRFSQRIRERERHKTSSFHPSNDNSVTHLTPFKGERAKEKLRYVFSFRFYERNFFLQFFLFSPFVSMREIFSSSKVWNPNFSYNFFLSFFDFSFIFPQLAFCCQLDMTIYFYFFISNSLSSVKCHPTRCPLSHSQSLTVFGMEFPGRICQGRKVKEERKKSTEPAVTCDFNQGFHSFF